MTSKEADYLIDKHFESKNKPKESEIIGRFSCSNDIWKYILTMNDEKICDVIMGETILIEWNPTPRKTNIFKRIINKIKSFYYEKIRIH